MLATERWLARTSTPEKSLLGLGDFGISEGISAALAIANLSLAAFNAYSSYDLNKRFLDIKEQEGETARAIAFETLAIEKRKMELEELRATQQSAFGVPASYLALIVGAVGIGLVFLLRRR